MTSAALHLAVVLLFIFGLPEISPEPPQEESVKVELVSPPPPKPEAKPQKEPEAQPEPRSPLAFESAMAQTEQENTETSLPPAEPEAPVESKPIVPDPTAPKVETAAKSNETEEPLEQKTLSSQASPQDVPAPEPKPLPDPKENRRTETAEEKTRQGLKNLVQAQNLFSPNALSDPRVRQAMGKLSPRQRLLQLCTTEALNQIRRQLPNSYPDMLVPYSTSGGRISRAALDAKGGAFRSRGNWYNIDYKCKVDADASKVVSFSFVTGGAIPKEQWNMRQLPTN